MKFILTAGWEDGIADLTQSIIHELSAGKKVLWLLSGGSNIAVSVEVMGKISTELSKNLTVSLIDERYGESSDYPDSNWNKLLTAGFKPKKATLKPVLEDGLGFEQVLEKYNRLLKDAFRSNDIVIAQLGIGDDGHIAGILPESPASIDTKSYVIGYQSQPFLRLTMTFYALKKVDVAYAYAFGNNKHETLNTLYKQDIAVSKQPAQILKQIPEAYLYSDQVGENA